MRITQVDIRADDYELEDGKRRYVLSMELPARDKELEKAFAKAKRRILYEVLSRKL